MKIRSLIVMTVFSLVAIKLLTGCADVTITETTTVEQTTTIEQERAKIAIIDEVCGHVEPECRRLQCAIDVVSWLDYEQAIEPTQIQGGI